jgi:hypothetical protein
MDAGIGGSRGVVPPDGISPYPASESGADGSGEWPGLRRGTAAGRVGSTGLAPLDGARLARNTGIRVQKGTDHRWHSHRAQSVPRRKCE